jgi:hypothetical protein
MRWKKIVDPKSVTELSLTERFLQNCLWFGLPLSIWELFDVFRGRGIYAHLGDQRSSLGVPIAMFGTVVVGLFVTLIEQPVLVLLRRKLKGINRRESTPNRESR